MWKKVGENIGRYRSYPRLVGETGGKDFIVAHPSADPQEVAVAIARGGFEYQGQKCSAASRVYVPQSLWSEVRDRTVAMMKDIKIGDVRDFRNFMGAVIDKKAFVRDQRLPRRREEEREGVVRAGPRRATPATSSSRRSSRPPIRLSAAVRGDLRAGGHRVRVSGRQVGRHAGDRRSDVTVRADRRGVRPRSRRRSVRRSARCAMPPATSTSTTSRPARSSGSSRSAARADPARTTRRVRS